MKSYFSSAAFLSVLFILCNHTNAASGGQMVCPKGSIANMEKTACCPESCGTCGGDNCNLRTGGPTKCCSSAAKMSCAVAAAPCLLGDGNSKPNNSNGNKKPNEPKAPGGGGMVCPKGSIANMEKTACCPESCGTCGGDNCHLRTGGATKCCSSGATKSCAVAMPPCTPSDKPMTPNNPKNGGGNQPVKPEKPAAEENDAPVEDDMAMDLSGYPVCKQTERPPGVKPGSCMQVTCLPKSVSIGEVFHTTLVWCLQRPRKHYTTVNFLDMDSKEYLGGTGVSSKEPYQCGQHTFEVMFKQPATSTEANADIMWKFFSTPLWGPDNGLKNDPFPNMLAESGVAKQPAYGDLIGDCKPVKTMFWNLAPTGDQDGIFFPEHPTCITPGQPWEIEVDVHIESADAYDLHVNMMLGTGGDKYLGGGDKYVTETNRSNIAKSTNGQYYRSFTIDFTGEQTELLEGTKNMYVSAFLTPVGQIFGDVPGGFTYVETEYYLSLKLCNN